MRIKNGSGYSDLIRTPEPYPGFFKIRIRNPALQLIYWHFSINLEISGGKHGAYITWWIRIYCAFVSWNWKNQLLHKKDKITWFNPYLRNVFCATIWTSGEYFFSHTYFLPEIKCSAFRNIKKYHIILNYDPGA